MRQMCTSVGISTMGVGPLRKLVRCCGLIDRRRGAWEETARDDSRETFRLSPISHYSKIKRLGPRRRGLEICEEVEVGVGGLFGEGEPLAVGGCV